MRVLSVGALLAAIITAALAGLLLTSTLRKNAELKDSLNVIGTSAAQYQHDNNQMLQAIAQTAAVQPEFPTPVPTEIPTPTMIPTLGPVYSEPAAGPEEENIISRPPTEAPTATVSAADARLDAMVGRDVTVTLSNSMGLYSTEGLSGQLGRIFDPNKPLSGRLTKYTDRAVNVEIPFNIGRSQISDDNNVGISTYLRLYSNVPSETAPIIILDLLTQLVSPATDCTDGPQSFCHGTISIWFDRTAIENNIN